jgi:hypothetical protein
VCAYSFMDSELAMRWRGGSRLALLVLVLAGAAGAVPRAHALEWGLIDPGTTAMDAVRARYGEATTASNQKIDEYNSTRWVYEGARAPVGMERMVVDFGLLTPQGYRPQIVRSVLLHPKPGTFSQTLVVQGWGLPTAVGAQSGALAYLYEEGLFVSFDEDGWNVLTMLFTPRQKMPPPESEPPR